MHPEKHPHTSSGFHLVKMKKFIKKKYKLLEESSLSSLMLNVTRTQFVKDHTHITALSWTVSSWHTTHMVNMALSFLNWSDALPGTKSCLCWAALRPGVNTPGFSLHHVEVADQDPNQWQSISRSISRLVLGREMNKWKNESPSSTPLPSYHHHFNYFSRAGSRKHRFQNCIGFLKQWIFYTNPTRCSIFPIMMTGLAQPASLP